MHCQRHRYADVGVDAEKIHRLRVSLAEAAAVLAQNAGAILRFGLPSAGENLSYAGSQLVVTAIIAFLGTEALTTKVYASTISQFVALFAMSIGQASQIIIGRAVGRGK